jgi:hypothetical protein
MRPLLFTSKPATPVLWAGTVLVLLGLAPAVCRADVILGNLGTGDGSTSLTLNSTTFTGASFTMGSQAYSLSDVQITLENNPSSGTIFQLESDASGKPSSAVLFTFTTPTFGSGLATYTFPVSSPFTLAANSKYWLVGLTNSGSTSWVASNTSTNPAGGGATFGSYSFSASSGASWSNLSGFTPEFQVNGTPSVGSPEPSSLLLTGMAACMAAAVGWRRRRTRRPDLAS